MRHTRKQKSENFIHEFNSDNEVEIIPSEKDINGENEEKSEQVGAYCRVSTMSEQQVESYELQKAYYEELVTRRPNWNLVDIYPDEGISATSMKNRKNFNKMLADCKAGKITLIITKSVSRFARNVVDAISTIRMLRNLNPPVAVYFETEHIITTAPGADAQYLRRNFCEPLIDIETFNTAQAMLGNMSPEDFLVNCNVIDGSNTSDESLRYIQFPPQLL